MCLCNRVVSDARIMKVISLMKDHERVPASTFWWTAVEVTYCNYILILALAKGPLVI